MCAVTVQFIREAQLDNDDKLHVYYFVETKLKNVDTINKYICGIRRKTIHIQPTQILLWKSAQNLDITTILIFEVFPL